MDNDKIQKVVRDAYGKIAQGQECCGCGSCGPSATEFAKSLGYSEKELEDIPKEANLSLSCGNPIALANLREGEVALDLGSGAGFDCFLAVARVGREGKVIGMDMTPEMVEKARDNAKKNNINNYVECVGGALLVDEYEEIAEASGLKDVTLTIKKSAACIDSNTTDPTSRATLDGLAENESLEEYVVSVDVEGYK